MLTVLRRIVQELSEAQNLRDALQLLVSNIREAMHTEACTIYLLEPQSNEFVLMATAGLNEQSVGKVRIAQKFGLIGMVASRGEPINVANALEHPQFHFVQGLGEERFRAYMGVPIVYHRSLLGVLVVQQEEERRFDESEEAFLMTLSVQLGAVISNAEAQSRQESPGRGGSKRPKDATFHGVPGAPGVAIGVAVVVYPPADLDAVPDREVSDVAEEVAAFQVALSATQEEIKALRHRVVNSMAPEEQSLFEVYLRILESKQLLDEVIAHIKQGQWAQGALRRVMGQHIRKFRDMEDDYLRERAQDIEDLGRRILANLQQDRRSVPDYPEHTILVGDEVSAAALAEVPEGRLVGIVSRSGSSNSHVAILARSLGIPSAMGVESLPVGRLEAKELIVDGYYGHVYLSPSAGLRHEFSQLVREEKEFLANLEELRDQPARTMDGKNFGLYVNTGLVRDISRALTVGAEGVGLYRTEVPFMVRDRFPTEEEQRVIYRQLLATFAPRPVVMRTLDVGGDKPLPYFPISEDNPALGWRGLRITLDHPEIFLVQLRAMLRANKDHHNLRIMFPMVTTLPELNTALRLLRQVHEELAAEGEEVPMPQVGVMIEVPSAVFHARAMARRVDFLSVGSNDLAQYILAVDRNNARVANLYDALHPSVLSAIQNVVLAAHQEQKPVSICGEMAGDPAGVVLLMGMGFDVLSCTAVSLPRVKWIIRNFTAEQARDVLKKAMLAEDAAHVRGQLDLVLDRAGLGGLIRAGK